MRSQRKGGLSAITQVKVLSPEIINIALGQGVYKPEASIATCVKGEHVSVHHCIVRLHRDVAALH